MVDNSALIAAMQAMLAQLVAQSATPAAAPAPSTPPAPVTTYGQGSFYAMAAQTPAQWADLVKYLRMGPALPADGEAGVAPALNQAAVDAGYFTESTHADAKHNDRDVSHYTTASSRSVAWACAENRYADGHIFASTAERDAYLAQHDANWAAHVAAEASYGQATPSVPGA